MADMSAEYLLRVRERADGFEASLSQVCGAAHPEVRAVMGPVAHGHGANPPAAMVNAIANAHIGEIPSAVHEVHRGC